MTVLEGHTHTQTDTDTDTDTHTHTHRDLGFVRTHTHTHTQTHKHHNTHRAPHPQKHTHTHREIEIDGGLVWGALRCQQQMKASFSLMCALSRPVESKLECFNQSPSVDISLHVWMLRLL